MYSNSDHDALWGMNYSTFNLAWTSVPLIHGALTLVILRNLVLITISVIMEWLHSNLAIIPIKVFERVKRGQEKKSHYVLEINIKGLSLLS